MASLTKQSRNYELVTQCDLCAGRETKLVDQPGWVVQCRCCGLRFVARRMPQKNIFELYDRHRKECPGWGQIVPQAQLMHQRRFAFVNKFVQGGKILDVGAGLGEFLALAKNSGRWQYLGTETSSYAIEFAQKKFGLELSCGQLENLAYPDDYFDAVCFWHVLEHLPSPARAIQESRRILKPDRFLFIAVPNDSWLGRRHFFKNVFKQAINRLPLKKKLKLKKMHPEAEEAGNKHLFYFTPRTLSRLLEKHGFRIIQRSVDYDYGRPSARLERKYRFDLLICRLSGINLSNAILIAAQKETV